MKKRLNNRTEHGSGSPPEVDLPLGTLVEFNQRDNLSNPIESVRKCNLPIHEGNP